MLLAGTHYNLAFFRLKLFIHVTDEILLILGRLHLKHILRFTKDLCKRKYLSIFFQEFIIFDELMEFFVLVHKLWDYV